MTRRVPLHLSRAFRYLKVASPDHIMEIRDARRRLTTPDERFSLGLRDAIAHLVRLHRGADRFSR